MAEQSTRQLSEYVAIVRRRLWLIALIAAVTVGAAGVYTFNQPTVYRSSTKIVVGQGSGIFSTQVGNVAEQFTQTFSDLLQSSVVATQVIQNLRLDLTPAQLLKNLHVLTKPDTAVLQVLYDDTDPKEGTRILEEVGKVFTGLVESELVQRDENDKPVDPTSAVSATVFDPAHALPGTVQPSPKRNLAVALVLGLMLGAVAAFVREQFDDTVRGVPEAEEAFGQVTTATLPEQLIGYRPFETRVSRHRPDPVVAELFIERLRASILWSPESREARTLLVTSASPQDGKTTVAANLSVALAKEGHDVIVVDSDLRRPALHRYMAIRVGPETIGLDAVVRGEADLSQALVEIPLVPHSLAWISAQDSANGSVPPQRGGRLRAVLAAPGHTWPSDLGIRRPVQILERLRQMADYVVIDAAPILVVADAYAFVAAVDTVIAVVRVGRTAAAAVEGMSRTLERLRTRRRIELVVTGAESMFGGEYYDYRTRGGRERPPTHVARRDRGLVESPGSPVERGPAGY